MNQMSPAISVTSILDALLTHLAMYARIILILMSVSNLFKLVACQSPQRCLETSPVTSDSRLMRAFPITSGPSLLETFQIPHLLESVPMTSRSHLSERHHIADHVGNLVGDINRMSEDQLQFLYFKIHDSDGDDRLDGRELVDSLLHFHVEESSPKVFSSDELADMIDPILTLDDIDSDGFIDYGEFVSAQKARAF